MSYTALHCTAQHCIALHKNTLHFTILDHIALQSYRLHFTSLHWISHQNTQYFTALHCIVPCSVLKAYLPVRGPGRTFNCCLSSLVQTLFMFYKVCQNVHCRQCTVHQVYSAQSEQLKKGTFFFLYFIQCTVFTLYSLHNVQNVHYT